MGQAVNGHVELFVGPLLFAEVPVAVFVSPARQSRVEAPPEQRSAYTEAAAHLYRRIFASYSHKDSEVVRLMETTVQRLGDRYLRDVELLRSGERWNDRLLQAIGEADIFQLFWSKPAAQSPYVEEEWRHALALQRAGRAAFIRPVYWTRAPFAPPRELADLHFEPLDLRQLGWGPRRGLFAWLARGQG